MATGCSIVSAGTSIVHCAWLKQRERDIVSGEKHLNYINIRRHSVSLEFTTRLEKYDSVPKFYMTVCCTCSLQPL